MKLSVVALLGNFEISENIKFNGEKLEKQGSQINQFNDQEMIQAIGKIQHNELTKYPCFYFNTEIAPFPFQDLEKMLELGEFIHDALFSLWLTKDNSVNSYVMVSRSDDNNISTNRTPTLISNSIGEYRKTFFSKEELQVAETWAQLILEMYTETELEPIISKVRPIGEIVFNNKNKDIQYDKTNRLQRTIHFVNIARKESFLPGKITFYISALESLLSDTNAELKFQVADRSARILGENQEEKLKISKSVGDAYDFRSKYIHGTAGKKNASEGLLIEVDDILRRLIKLFLTDLKHVVQMKDDKFRVWLKELQYK
ncbi:HEPN domain-containing protein [Peribacillus frigoritolerans]|uniref:HEPN domain-containing protein n=1 Tax=Peribacillus frigoritolerans TaxID=450367 RepID=UPI0024C1BC6A|nr:HEPN domain-containing protein [Peribacillus frigoritolerans]WHX62349.1 HEPN domain-containing protein [Peribacillus frigoritolerans]